MRHRLAAPAAVLLLSMTTACSEQESPTAGPGPRPTVTSTSTPAAPSPSPVPSPSPTASRDDDEPPPEEAPFPADRSRDEAEGSGRVSITDLRFGRHQGYDRVVVDLAGSGTPGWFAEYEDDPRNQGRGDPVDIEGQSVLEVNVTGVEYPTSPGAQEYRGPDQIDPAAAGVVAEVQRGVLYEGYQQVFIGLSAPEQPFRVFRLADPPRVVIDIQHPR